MWFRNLQLFRLQKGWHPDVEALAASLARTAFRPCSALERQSQGWVPPRGEAGEMVHVLGPHLLFSLGVEQKILPVSVVRQYTQERLLEIEAAQGFKPGRSQARETFDAVEAELLPKALVKRRLTYIWMDLQGGWMVVDAASSGKADEVIEQLKESLGELPLALVKTLQAPGTAMTQWLSLGEVPGPFSIDQDCELRAPGDGGGTVRYSRLPLDSEEVRQHITQGKQASRLALTWEDRVSFVLTEQMQIKRLAFLDVVREAAEAADDNGDTFAADFAIMSGELSRLLPYLVSALGGEAE